MKSQKIQALQCIMTEDAIQRDQQQCIADPNGYNPEQFQWLLDPRFYCQHMSTMNTDNLLNI